MNEKIMECGFEPEIPNRYRSLFAVLMKDMKLFVRKWIIILKYVKTGENQKCKFVFFERKYQQQLLHLFAKRDIKAISQIPQGSGGSYATRLEIRYTPSGSFVGMQVIEARPHDNGDYYPLTPAVLFFEEEGKKLLPYIKQMKLV